MDTSIVSKIKNIRELKNYTQQYMAGQLGITQAGYSKIEKGETRLSYEKLEKIAGILQVSVQDVIYFQADRYFSEVKANCTGSSIVNSYQSTELEKRYEDKILLLEKLLSKAESELGAYREKFGII